MKTLDFGAQNILVGFMNRFMMVDQPPMLALSKGEPLFSALTFTGFSNDRERQHPNNISTKATHKLGSRTCTITTQEDFHYSVVQSKARLSSITLLSYQPCKVL